MTFTITNKMKENNLKTTEELRNRAYLSCINVANKVSYLLILYCFTKCSRKHSTIHLRLLLKHELMLAIIWSLQLRQLPDKSVLWFWNQCNDQMPQMQKY